MNRLTPEMFEPEPFDDGYTDDTDDYYRGYKDGRKEEQEITQVVIDKWATTLAWTRLVVVMLSAALAGMLLSLFGC